MSLKQAEHIAKWIAAITACFIAIRFVWLTFVKAYKYLAESNERKEMLEHILSNQTYTIAVTKAIMDKFGLAYFKADLKGYTIEVSDVICKMLGYVEADLIGLNWSIRIVDEDKHRVMDDFDKSVKYGTDFDCTYSVICGNGVIKKIHVVAKKTPIYYFGILTEIK